MAAYLHPEPMSWELSSVPTRCTCWLSWPIRPLRLDQRSLRVVLRFEPGDTDIDSDDDQPAKQFGDIQWKLTSRGRGTIVRSFGGGDALWSFRCNNTLEKGLINTQGVSRLRDLADGVTLLRSTYAGAVVLPESRLPTDRDCSCRRAGVWRRGWG